MLPNQLSHLSRARKAIIWWAKRLILSLVLRFKMLRGYSIVGDGRGAFSPSDTGVQIAALQR